MVTVKELMSLKGRRALITGAAGGIGSIMAETLAELGADLILVDRPGVDFGELVDSLKRRWSVEVWYSHCDLEHRAQRRELIQFVRDNHPTLDILVNNAAFVGTSALEGWNVPYEEQLVDIWPRVTEVNLTAPFHLCQGLTPCLANSQGASVINIGSIYGEYGPDWRLYQNTAMSNPAAYGASKGGLLQLTRWLATTLAPQIRVNAISPGGVFRGQPATFVDRYTSRTPLMRMATEDDFRGAIAYLASDLSKYVTGQTLAVDGGWGIW